MTSKNEELLVSTSSKPPSFTFSREGIIEWFKIHGPDVIIAIIVFFLAYYVKILFYYWFKNHIGDFFTLRATSGDAALVRRIMYADPKEPLEWQGFGDMGYYYIPYVNSYAQGWNPYTGSSTPDSPLNGYVYGPLYVFFISIGTMWFGLPAEKSIFYSNLLFDAGTVMLVYLIARKTTGYALSFWASAVTAVSPVVLFYSDFKLLNMPQVTFFALLALYFLINDHDDLAIFSIAIGFLTKQVPLLMLGPALIYLFRKTGVKKTISYFLLFILYILLFSFPWIAKTPKLVLLRMFAPGTGKTTLTIPAKNVSMTLPESLLYKGYTDIAQAIFPYFTNHVFFIGAMAISALLVFFGYDYLHEDPSLQAKYYAFFFLIGHVTLARGLYKYYDAFFIPFMALALFMQPPNPYGIKKYVYGKQCTSCKEINSLENKTCKCGASLENAMIVIKYPLSPDQEQALKKREVNSVFIQALLTKYKDAVIKWGLDVVYAVIATGILYYINIQILNPKREEHPLILFYITIFFALWMGTDIWASIYIKAPSVYQEYKEQFLAFIARFKTEKTEEVNDNEQVKDVQTKEERKNEKT